MTLHDRIRAVVEERLAAARSYLDACGGSHGWCGDECEQFQSDNDPSDAILSAEHALGILERHQPVNGLTEPDPAGDYCDYCSHLTQIGHPYPCAETVALATRWRVEVDG